MFRVKRGFGIVSLIFVIISLTGWISPIHEIEGVVTTDG